MDLINEYLAGKELSCKKGSVKEYRRQIMQLVQFYGSSNFSNFKKVDLLGYKRYIESTTSLNNWRHVLTCLKPFLFELFQKGIVDFNAHHIKLPKKEFYKKEIITYEECEKLANYWNKINYINLRNKIIIWLLYDTGARVGELVSINIENLGPQEAEIVTEKTNVISTINWSEETQLMLKEYLDKRIELYIKSDALFVGGNRSSRLTTRSVQRVIEKTGNIVLGRNINPHMFRHSVAYRMFLENDKDIILVQKKLRHSSPISTAQNYTQWMDKHIVERLQRSYRK